MTDREIIEEQGRLIRYLERCLGEVKALFDPDYALPNSVLLRPVTPGRIVNLLLWLKRRGDEHAGILLGELGPQLSPALNKEAVEAGYLR